jgi:hypothetical protein
MMLVRSVAAFLLCVSTAVAATGLYAWTTSGLNNTQSITDCLESKNSAQFIQFDGMYYAKVCEEICYELSNAAKSGIAHRDVLFSPCPTCADSAAKQIDTLVTYLTTTCAAGTWSGRLWLDMMSNGYWPTPWHPIGYTSNQEWYNDMVDACLATKGITCGIYSASDKYKYIVGTNIYVKIVFSFLTLHCVLTVSFVLLVLRTGSNDYVYEPATTLPLWYRSLDGVTSFDNFVSFGGFTKLYAKEYQMLAYGYCGTPYIYEDWAPEW